MYASVSTKNYVNFKVTIKKLGVTAEIDSFR